MQSGWPYITSNLHKSMHNLIDERVNHIRIGQTTGTIWNLRFEYITNVQQFHVHLDWKLVAHFYIIINFSMSLNKIIILENVDHMKSTTSKHLESCLDLNLKYL